MRLLRHRPLIRRPISTASHAFGISRTVILLDHNANTADRFDRTNRLRGRRYRRPIQSEARRCRLKRLINHTHLRTAAGHHLSQPHMRPTAGTPTEKQIKHRQRRAVTPAPEVDDGSRDIRHAFHLKHHLRTGRQTLAGEKERPARRDDRRLHDEDFRLRQQDSIVQTLPHRGRIDPGRRRIIGPDDGAQLPGIEVAGAFDPVAQACGG